MKAEDILESVRSQLANHHNRGNTEDDLVIVMSYRQVGALQGAMALEYVPMATEPSRLYGVDIKTILGLERAPIVLTKTSLTQIARAQLATAIHGEYARRLGGGLSIDSSTDDSERVYAENVEAHVEPSDHDGVEIRLETPSWDRRLGVSSSDADDEIDYDYPWPVRDNEESDDEESGDE